MSELRVKRESEKRGNKKRKTNKKSGTGRRKRENYVSGRRGSQGGSRQISVMEKQVARCLFVQTHTVNEDHLVLHHHRV